MWTSIRRLDDLLAHNSGERYETLQQHSDQTLFYYHQLEKIKHLDQILGHTISRIRFSGESLNQTIKSVLSEMFVKAVYWHDIGKINPAFQRQTLKNKKVAPLDYADTSHAMLSAILYLDLVWTKIDRLKADPKWTFLLRYFAFGFSYSVSRHHTGLLNIIGDDCEEKTYLNDLENYLTKLEAHPRLLRYYKKADRVLQAFPINKIRNTQAKVRHRVSPLTTYILIKLCYSCIVSCDFFATQRFMKNQEVPLYTLTDKDKKILYRYYANKPLYQSIRHYQDDVEHFNVEPINKLRSELFLESERQLRRHQNEHMFFLEAPTGSGKTNISINLSLTLLKNDADLQKVLYVFPFNTLTEQTKETLDDIFPKNLQQKYPVSIVNSAEPIMSKKKAAKASQEKIDYESELLKYQTIQYPFTLTSHVHLFNFLFGSTRQANLGLVHLANSVIILDEIQSYKNELWPAIAQLLYEYAQCLNIRMIIMSATLPKIDAFLPESRRFVNLVPRREKYFNDPLFKNRVHLNFKLLDCPRDALFDHMCQIIDHNGPKRYLFEFIYRSAARDFYDKFCEKYPDKLVIELTGDDNNYYRKEIIDQLNHTNNGQWALNDVIIVATQVIEAGLNIDMDIGFKDISLFDSEEQFLGRINRSCKRQGCTAYFFNYSDATVLYGQDSRLEYDLNDQSVRQALIEKNFKPLYEKAFQWIRPGDNDPLLSHIKRLRYKDVEDDMRLIDQVAVTLYLPYHLEINQRIIDGEKLWHDFRQLLRNRSLPYAEKTIKLSQIQVEMSYFTYPFYLKKGTLPLYADEEQIVGDLFYISCGSEYMKKDERTGYYKFDRKKYMADSGSDFL
ncbi:CRISPR-associated helicase Cas3' [Sporolactobacillus sp. Y61]|uniref:CRISPR-associated helicase Cas3 n=1 Tax=Sporolactobacillus sp. Y61 TaxID=3160863 RepID=A0AAU8IIB4_9BACL